MCTCGAMLLERTKYLYSRYHDTNTPKLPNPQYTFIRLQYETISVIPNKINTDQKYFVWTALLMSTCIDGHINNRIIHIISTSGSICA